MGAKYLIDTNAVIKYLTVIFPSKEIEFMDSIVDEESVISFITEIELQVWNPIDPSDLDVYLEFISSSRRILPDDPIIQETIKIRKAHNLKIPDALIAATAIVHDLILLSDNDKDFKKVNGLKYINPMTLH